MLVTGATGFLGGHVCAALAARGVAVRGLVRRADAPPPENNAPSIPAASSAAKRPAIATTWAASFGRCGLPPTATCDG